MKSLIVDDESASRKKMRKILSAFGECEAVDNGNAAVTSFVQAWERWTPFDLMTLDVSMPEMDGIQVLNRIRSIEKEKNVKKEKRVKIVMVSSHLCKDVVMSCIKAECDDFVVKPFDKGNLIAKIDEFFTTRG